MARFTVGPLANFGYTQNVINFFEITEGELVVANASLIRVDYGDGEIENYGGTFGFAGSLAGEPTSGTLRSFSSSFNGVTAYSITGFAVDAPTFVNAVNTPSRSDDFAILADALSGNDVFLGGTVGDELIGYAGNDNIQGRGGNDILDGDAGNDRLFGGAGNDIGMGDEGNDRFSGSLGNDQFYGGSGVDIGIGGDGNDRMYGGDDNDRLFGGDGNDTGEGGDGNDILRGEGNRDRLFGGEGIDRLFGGDDVDVLRGDGGNDLYFGGLGGDRLLGGAGSDRFYFNSVEESQAGSRDIITSFESGTDLIFLRGMDADETVAGNQTFSFIGAERFSGEAGELRVQGAIVQGDVDGDRRADFLLTVRGDAPDEASDFIL
ncbi:MAG: calcium-binding protein [Pseudomonadota bacterium]